MRRKLRRPTLGCAGRSSAVTSWSVALSGSVSSGHTGRATVLQGRYRAWLVAGVAVLHCCAAVTDSLGTDCVGKVVAGV